MLVHVVRHACAGRKRDWPGHDDERPLDDGGWAQAEAIADVLAQWRIRRLLASPARRCIETLEPLSEHSGVPTRIAKALDRRAKGGDLLRYVCDPHRADAVLCTHGEGLTSLLQRLRRRGVKIDAAKDDDDDWLLRKGSVWTLDVHKGDVRRLQHHLPLPLDACGHARVSR